jgi:hypothetical protein
MTNATSLAAILALVLAFGLVGWAGLRRRRALIAEFGHDGGFRGPCFECDVGVPELESSVRCRLGADASALYVMATAERGAFTAAFGSDLRLPWDRLRWRVGRVFFKRIMWFEDGSRQLHLYLPLAVGQRLLRDAGRDAPA